MLLLSTAWRRLYLDRHANFLLGELRPTWSLRERRARVVDIIDESTDTKTFVLAPSRWPGHTAGQYVPVDLEIAGKRVRRCYSITSLPGDRRRVAITVKRVPGGRVSGFLHDHVRRGTIVTLGDPAGDFVLPERVPARLALVAGGSGITPILGMLRDLVDRAELTDVVVVYAVREDRAAFVDEFHHHAVDLPGLRVVVHAGAHLTAADLVARVPDLATREVYTCGPAPLMDLVAAAAGKPIHRERFVAAIPATRSANAPARVHLAIADRTVAIDGSGTLLEQLERAGERPAHGCRMGICNTCRCTKRSGVVEDLATGALSTEPDQEIRLCTSVARGDLELAL